MVVDGLAGQANRDRLLFYDTNYKFPVSFFSTMPQPRRIRSHHYYRVLLADSQCNAILSLCAVLQSLWDCFWNIMASPFVRVHESSPSDILLFINPESWTTGEPVIVK